MKRSEKNSGIPQRQNGLIAVVEVEANIFDQMVQKVAA